VSGSRVLAPLALAVHLVRVATLPVGTARPADGLAVAVALAETARLAVGRRESAHLAVLVHRVDNPLDVRVAADGLVVGVGADDLKELVRGILPHPVAVEDTQGAALAPDTLLSDCLE